MIHLIFCFQCKVAAPAEEEENIELREPESKKRKTDCEFFYFVSFLNSYI